MKSGEQHSDLKAHSKPHGCAKRGGRPVTWIGGGGLDPKKLAGLGVPSLRELFAQVFGENTASNNAGWLRRKLAESPDSVHGQRRSLIVRARDMGAAIWNSPVVTPGEVGQEEAGAETAEGLEGGECAVPATPPPHAIETNGVSCKSQLDQYLADASATVLHGNSSHRQHQHRGVKRSCTEASATLAHRVSAAPRCNSPSVSGSGIATATHQDGSVSPRPHHKHHHHHHHHHDSSGTSKQHSPVASGVGAVIRPESLTDSYHGLKVMVYWPADKKWWEATICGLNTAVQHLQLLYSDLTEESIMGHDFTDLLRKGHLALAYGQTPPAGAGGAQAVQVPTTAAPAAVGSGPVPAHLPGVPTVHFGLLSTLYEPSAQSCLLPSNVCIDSRASHQKFNRNMSMNLCARVSTTGTDSGSGSGAASALELGGGQAAKRPCYEESNNNSGSDGSTRVEVTPASLGVGFATQSEQQRHGSDGAQLEVWFASQQRQQQQLQLQMQANLQMQQQVQMQMQQQMAVHMSMQQAAGQYMHMQAPALSAPYGAATVVQTQDLHSQFAGVVGHCSLTSGGATAPVMQKQWSFPAVQLPACCSLPGSSSASPKACNDIVPELSTKLASTAIGSVAAWQGLNQQQQQQASVQQQLQARPSAADCTLVPSTQGGYTCSELEAERPSVCCRQVDCLEGFAGNSDQDRAAAAASDVIETLLDGTAEDLFGYQPLGPESASMEQSLAGAAAALDGDLDGCDLDGCDRCSSGGNSSLCESVADELAVAGLDADDAPGYYMFGGGGSPRKQSVQQAGDGTCAYDAAYAQQCQDVEAELALVVCCGQAGSGSFGDNTGFKVASEPCENSFEHMFDFD